MATRREIRINELGKLLRTKVLVPVDHVIDELDAPQRHGHASVFHVNEVDRIEHASNVLAMFNTCDTLRVFAVFPSGCVSWLVDQFWSEESWRLFRKQRADPLDPYFVFRIEHDDGIKARPAREDLSTAICRVKGG